VQVTLVVVCICGSLFASPWVLLIGRSPPAWPGLAMLGKCGQPASHLGLKTHKQLPPKCSLQVWQ
jgi:hypothetical protein